MFGISASELAVIAAVAALVLGPVKSRALISDIREWLSRISREWEDVSRSLEGDDTKTTPAGKKGKDA